MPEKVIDGGLRPNRTVAIGIDQSLTGFAVSVIDVLEPTWYKTWVYKSPNKGVQRLADIFEWFQDKLDFLETNGNSVYDIAMEGTVLQSQAASVLGELAGIVKLSLYDYFGTLADTILRTPLQVPPMTLKKFVAGKGNAKKQEMLMQIYKRWGVEFNDDNAADAYGLARIAGECVTDDVEKQVIKQLKDPKFRDQLAQ